MNPYLVVLSRHESLINRVKSRFGSQFELMVLDGVDNLEAKLADTPIRAVLIHLDRALGNGHASNKYLSYIRRSVATAPIYGLVEPECPGETVEHLSRWVREVLYLPEEFDRLDRLLLEDDLGLDSELLSHFVGLPYRVLRGTTRSLVTFAPSMFEMFEELKVAAAHDVTILLIGETGSGKTYLARLIHELSPRRNQRCLTVACGALPPDLIESELFGYVKGAFTGADTDKPGKFAAADRGTLLLDEIDVLAPKQQAKLLRVIETGEYEPVGSNDTRISHARLIAASNIDLEKLVEADKFRRDLYYRLNTLSFHLPPLRERPWDIEYLARKFAIEHSRAHQIELKHIEPEFLAALRQYSWPGNIRELENVIRRAVLYCRDGVLTVADLPSTLRPANTGRSNHSPDRQHALTLEERLRQVERRIIEETLQRNNYRRTETARELGISRITLYNKMKKLGILHLL
jgi:transcriptional regulator with PAS, ATPase and Fis domain